MAQLRVSLADRLRSVLALERAATGWKVERGAVTFGSGVPALPADPGRSHSRTDQLPRSALRTSPLWQQARLDPRAPHFQAQLVATQMVAAGRSFPEVLLTGERTDSGVELNLDSEQLAGVAHWPAAGSAESRARRAAPDTPEHPRGYAGGAARSGRSAAVGSSASVSVDDLTWEGQAHRARHGNAGCQRRPGSGRRAHLRRHARRDRLPAVQGVAEQLPCPVHPGEQRCGGDPCGLRVSPRCLRCQGGGERRAAVAAGFRSSLGPRR